MKNCHLSFFFFYQFFVQLLESTFEATQFQCIIHFFAHCPPTSSPSRFCFVIIHSNLSLALNLCPEETLGRILPTFGHLGRILRQHPRFLSLLSRLANRNWRPKNFQSTGRQFEFLTAVPKLAKIGRIWWKRFPWFVIGHLSEIFVQLWNQPSSQNFKIVFSE